MPGKSKKKIKGSGKFKIVPFEKLKSHKAWKVTSELVRRLAKGRCYTCEQKIEFKKMVAGHFIEKRGNARTYFDLDNLRGQCQWRCNRMEHGRKDIYALKLIKEKGVDIIQELHNRARKPKQWTAYELEEIWKDRKQQLEKLTTQ